MNKAPLQLILCNGADGSKSEEAADSTRLEYRLIAGEEPNIAIGLPSFIRSLGTVPSRVLDLIELASYVYCADRRVSRGAPDSVEYHGWSRRLLFRAKVRDIGFWRQDSAQRALRDLLEFLTGDEEIRFEFEGGHTTPAVSLFNTKEFEAAPAPAEVILFSGGLDSLAGTMQCLRKSSEPVCLVSHQSRQPSVARTQNQLARALGERFPQRVHQYTFTCHLLGERAEEETQRARFFLYATIAFALSVAFGRDRFLAYENGVTSLNFPRRQDALRGRTSRTTHPRTIASLRALFSLVREKPFDVATPFLWLTKSDVVGVLKDVDGLPLLSSTVSCTKTFKLGVGRTHCGCCTQCFDRRLAIYSREVEDRDTPSLYAVHLDEELGGEGRTVFVDYVRQAMNIGRIGVDAFYTNYASELSEVVSHIGEPDELAATEKVHDLFRRHHAGVVAALRRVLSVHDDPVRPVAAGSALSLMHDRAYFKEPVARIVEYLSDRLRKSIPIAFQHEPPMKEHALNDHVQAILADDRTRLEREHPSIRYATANAVPDHKVADCDLVIEGKYVRGTRPRSKITEEIAADLTKFKDAGHILFAVYDPQTKIADRAAFKAGIERGCDCTVLIVPS